MIQLLGIKFNHDPSSAAHDALNIRRNGADWVNVPEWQRGVSINPEDSPAAYAIGAIGGNQITIQAAFSCTDPGVRSAEIRARDNTIYGVGPGGCLGWVYSILTAIFQAIFGNPLGNVAALNVDFVNGASGYVTFQLADVTLSTKRVGTHMTEWRWEFRIGNGPWTAFDVSRHRIYVLLDVPTVPWQQAPYDVGNSHLPWCDVLDYACSWAAGSGSTDEAAAAVTRSVFNLGPSVVTYDCPGGGASHYSAGNFSCSAFLERLKGGVGLGIYVNCSDCATFVSSFANILGCDLWQSRMGNYFDLNAILAIGSSVWQTACNWGSFSYHEVAWTGACDVNDDVYDGCLEVDGDNDPTAPPHTPLLPTKLRFGNPGDLQYRDRLAAPSGRANCNPLVATRVRRQVV
ncbi:MAG TPA: hypothetical protein VFO25_08305 [Candidatus Eremiobacteraceae bacterium]|nr:hypothetical protein [Candidatus Eremiobacteraceae bacterium]